jgi:hypothetical protein
MKKISLGLAAAILISVATPVYAFEQEPFMGRSPYNGNWWNGPTTSQQFGREMDVSAYAKAHCHTLDRGPMGIGERRVCR